MVSTESSDARPLTVTWTVACCPACSVPDAGAKLTFPSRLDGSVMDHDTGPPAALIVSFDGASRLSTTVAGDTVSVPGRTVLDDGAGVVGPRVVGPGVVGAGVVGAGVVGCGVPDDAVDVLGADGPGDGAPELPAGVGCGPP